MAEIRSYGLVRHLRAPPTSHVLVWKRGKQRKSGPGLALWFAPLGASLAEVPLEDRDLALLIQARSADFQEVHVNVVVTYRVTEPEVLATRIDFSLDARTGRHLAEPLDKLQAAVVQLAHQLTASFLARHALADLLARGIDVMRETLGEGLAADPGLRDLGLAIVATRVASVRPSPEVEKALQMPTRERIQQSADEATFARRALAVDKERAIQENELANKIALTRREAELILQRGHNEKKKAEDDSEARRIAAAGAARDQRLGADADAAGITVIEAAKVEAERARMEIYRTLPPSALLGLAARELAGKLTSIDHLTLSPDVLGSLVQRTLGAHLAQLEGR